MVLKPFNLFFLLFSIGILSQELPPIENFTPINYGAENQNWGITQSDQKNIYTANNGGLLEFNGAFWRLYGSPNGSTIRSVQAVDDIVYTGCYMEFGYWEKNAVGDLIYNSISSELTIPLLEDEEFWNIVEMDDWMLFQSLERIYIYNISDKAVKVIDSKSTKAQIFNFEGTIYFQNSSSGLFKIENGATVSVSDDPLITGSVVAGIFSIDNRPLLVTENGAFYFFDTEKLTPWKAPFENESASVSVYSSLQLNDGSIVLGTISNGIYQIGRAGNILRHIDQENGLNNNTVLFIYEDIENNLWLALDNGISVINLNSPFNEYIDKNGKLGVVYASATYQGDLYLGTNQGLFYKRTNTGSEFSLVEGTKGQVWLLKIIDDILFCGHNNGTYVIEQDKSRLISDFPGTWDLKPIPNHENLLLQGNFNGLSVLEKDNGIWQLRNLVEGFDISSRFFEFIGENQVAVNREYKGIFKLDFDREYRKIVKVENEVSRGIGAGLVTYGGDVLYTCNNGVFKFDGKQKEFVADSIYTNLFYRTDDDPVGIFISDNKSKRLWCFTNNSIIYVSPGKFNAASKLRKIAISDYVRKNRGVLGFESLTPLAGDRYLIGISNGYLTLDLKKLSTKEYSIGINGISRKSNNSQFEKIVKDSATTFKFSQNNLFFSYNVAEYDK